MHTKSVGTASQKSWTSDSWNMHIWDNSSYLPLQIPEEISSLIGKGEAEFELTSLLTVRKPKSAYANWQVPLPEPAGLLKSSFPYLKGMGLFPFREAKMIGAKKNLPRRESAFLHELRTGWASQVLLERQPALCTLFGHPIKNMISGLKLQDVLEEAETVIYSEVRRRD